MNNHIQHNILAATKNNNNMDDKKKESILNLDETDFISYLYCERERENNLSQVPGWSNWALFGAMVAVLWTAYGIAKGTTINYNSLLYFMSGFIALFWNYRSWDNFFKRERGIDYGRVKFLKHVFPKVDLGMIYICSLFFVVAFIKDHKIEPIVWLWLAVIFLYSFAFFFGIVHRNTIVNSWLSNSFFPNFRHSIMFDLFASLLFCFIIPLSFNKASPTIFCGEFELGLCMATFIVLLYILIKTNAGNPVVKQFDVIIDEYLYKSVSKEVTYQKILSNRMGYGVIEACKNEIISINEMLNDYDNEKGFLLVIDTAIKKDDLTQDEMDDYMSKIDASICYQRKLIKVSKQLIEKVKQIKKCAPGLTTMDSLKDIIETYDIILDKIDTLSMMVSNIIENIRVSKKEYICHKYGGLCYNMDCEKRNDKMSLWNRLQLRLLLFNKKKHPISNTISDL